MPSDQESDRPRGVSPYLPVGTELGSYRIEAFIDRGGMAFVYEATDLRLDRHVALKVLAPELSGDPDFQERFLRESRFAASLEHPSIVPIYEAGDADGLLYIAMRYVRGKDLAAVLRDEGPLEPSRAVRLLSPVADALDAAHAAGLVHRDVKPANILITTATNGGREHVYLSDFGLTKQLAAPSNLTASGHFIGTMSYIAPEQIRGDTLDGRTDLYALGIVVYECLTGAPPFVHADKAAMMWAHLGEEPAPLSRHRADLAPADGVLARAMAKNLKDRHENCSQFMAALAEALMPETAADPAGTASGQTHSDTGPETQIAPRVTPGRRTPPGATPTPTRRTPPGATPTPTRRTPPGATPTPTRRTPPGATPTPTRRTPPGATPTPDRDSRRRSGPPTSGPPTSIPASTSPGRRNATAVTVGVGAVLVAALSYVGFQVLGGEAPPQGAETAPSSTASSPASPSVLASLPDPVVASTISLRDPPTSVTVEPNGSFAYVSHENARSLSVLDTASGTVTATIGNLEGPPQFITFTPDGQKAFVTLYAADGSGSAVAVIDTATNGVTATLPVGERPYAPAVTPDGSRLHVPVHDDSAVTVFDTATNGVVATIPVEPSPHWLAFSADGSRSYIANHESDLVSIANLTANTVTATIPVGDSPHSVAIAPDLQRLYVANYDGDDISVVDTASNTVTATIPVGANPQDVELAADGRHAYVVNNEAGTISVIDTAANQVTATVEVGSGPTTLSVTPDGRRAYVSNLDSSDLSVLTVGR